MAESKELAERRGSHSRLHEGEGREIQNFRVAHPGAEGQGWELALHRKGKWIHRGTDEAAA